MWEAAVGGGIQAVKWSLKLGYALAMIALLVIFLGIGVSALGVALNFSVLFDLLYLIQMWLPFNLAPIIAWLFSSVAAYLTWRLSLLGFDILHGVLD